VKRKPTEGHSILASKHSELEVTDVSCFLNRNRPFRNLCTRLR